jgi:hypothetical protein
MKNWKTTVAGLAAGFAYAFLAALQGGVSPKDAAVAGGLALIGSLAKDHNVTGGTVEQ